MRQQKPRLTGFKVANPAIRCNGIVERATRGRHQDDERCLYEGELTYEGKLYCKKHYPPTVRARAEKIIDTVVSFVSSKLIMLGPRLEQDPSTLLALVVERVKSKLS